MSDYINKIINSSLAFFSELNVFSYTLLSERKYAKSNVINWWNRNHRTLF